MTRYKTSLIALTIAALPTTAWLHSLSAAPKTATKKSVAQPQWEYAIVESGPRADGSATVATLAQKRFIFETGHDADSQVRLLNKLGALGWEVVGTSQDRYNTQFWTLKRRK